MNPPSSGDHYPPVYEADKLEKYGTSLASSAHMLVKYFTVNKQKNLDPKQVTEEQEFSFYP